MSSAMARNILRMFSACCSSWDRALNLDSLVTPSTRCATSDPKRSSTSEMEYSVSSGHVVEQGGLDGERVEPQLGQDLGDGQRMGDVRLARRAALRAVRLTREPVRLADLGQVGIREALPQLRLDALLDGVQRAQRREGRGDTRDRVLPARPVGPGGPYVDGHANPVYRGASWAP